MFPVSRFSFLARSAIGGDVSIKRKSRCYQTCRSSQTRTPHIRLFRDTCPDAAGGQGRGSSRNSAKDPRDTSQDQHRLLRVCMHICMYAWMHGPFFDTHPGVEMRALERAFVSPSTSAEHCACRPADPLRGHRQQLTIAGSIFRGKLYDICVCHL